jgi:hypothetical protein
MEFVEGQIAVRSKRISPGCGNAMPVIFEVEVVLLRRIAAAAAWQTLRSIRGGSFVTGAN